MNNLATLILLGMLTGAAAPAAALEPMRGAPPPAPDTGPRDQGPRAGIVQTQGGAAAQAPSTPGSQSNVMADPAQQIEPEGGPPVGALSLSQIITQIESRPDFAFIREIDWDDGRYDVQYRTRDGRDRNLKVDPRTGRPVEGALPMVQWPKS
jgi:hypothetical protein